MQCTINALSEANVSMDFNLWSWGIYVSLAQSYALDNRYYTWPWIELDSENKNKNKVVHEPHFLSI